MTTKANYRDSQFAGRVALITGAASGMGAACAREFTDRGAVVVVVDQVAPAARAVAAEIGAPPPLIGDVSQAAFCRQAVAEATDLHGRLDILVNCAGVIARRDAPATSDEEWRRVLGVNLDGVFFMSRAAVVEMRARGGGVIVNFGSIWGSVGATGVVAYCASKGAVHQLTRAMALDHVEEGIRINAVCPGEVNTPMLAAERPVPPSAEELRRLAENTVPMKRLAAPEEIARVVAFLASDDASYMTGALVNVDAGYTAR